jgi:hypothetical protein
VGGGTLHSGALGVIVVNQSDPLAVHFVVSLVIDPRCVEDIGADEHTLHENVRIHHLSV